MLSLPIPLALVAFSPIGRHARVRGERLDYWLQRWWSGGIVRRCGFRIVRVGEPLPGPVLFVANHVSWLDIELMHSQRVMSFVAKAEIARWPLIGWLAARAGTIFHRRGSGHSLNAVMEQAVERLRDGMAVGVFPGRRHRPGRSPAHLPCAHLPDRRGCAGDRAAGRDQLRQQRQNGFARAVRGGESFFANVVRLLGDPASRRRCASSIRVR
jgi:1-acyl-sn-glycerol-3-phosphate acyltransferase